MSQLKMTTVFFVVVVVLQALWVECFETHWFSCIWWCGHVLHVCLLQTMNVVLLFLLLIYLWEIYLNEKKKKAFIDFFYTGPTVAWLPNIFHDHCRLPDTVKPSIITTLLELYKNILSRPCTDAYYTFWNLPAKATSQEGPVKLPKGDWAPPEKYIVLLVFLVI